MELMELKDYEFVRVKGPDTLQFLQGQVTCDTDKLNTETSLVGAICNLKGRVIADFNLILDGEDCLLRTQLGMAEIIIKTLSKYAVFSKVKLILETEFTRVIGLLAEDGENLLSDTLGSAPANTFCCTVHPHAIVIRLPGQINRFEIWIRKEQALSHWKAGENQVELTDTWYREELLKGIVHVTPKNTEEYTPQLLNYDISGVIDFSKGCYTGQEVVARMHYRGKPKKKLFLLSCDEPVNENSTVSQSLGGKATIGKILAFSNKPSQSETPTLLLAVLNVSSTETNVMLSLSDQPESTLKIESLAYPAHTSTDNLVVPD